MSNNLKKNFKANFKKLLPLAKIKQVILTKRLILFNYKICSHHFVVVIVPFKALTFNSQSKIFRFIFKKKMFVFLIINLKHMVGDS